MGVFDTAADLQWGANSAFRGAEASRLYADRWIATNHPDTEIRYSLRQLRAASRDLVRNNPYASGIVESIADNVTGWDGIRCRPIAADPNDEIDRTVRWSIESAWQDWCENHATVDGIESWLETERLMDRAWATDGEILVRMRRGWDNPHGYAIELLDPDLLDEDFNEKRDRTGREIVMGVEIDRHGRPLAYHLWREHPDELGFTRQRERVDASEILHFFIRYRPGQHRGFPLLTPALTRFEMADGYEEAELVAARYHASKMGFITNHEPEAIQAYATRLAMGAEGGKGEVRRRHKMSPGLIPELEPGQGFVGFDPTHPNESFEPFLKTIFRGIARTAGMSYLTMTGDVSDANYSSMRSGLIPERDHWKVLQGIKARRIHRPVHRGWRSMARLTGALRIPASASDYRIDCRGRRWQWVDPEKDLKATEGEIKLGLTSRQRAAAERGHDFETVVDESREDMEYARGARVYVGGANAPTPSSRSSDEPSPNGNGNGRGATNARLVPYGG